MKKSNWRRGALVALGISLALAACSGGAPDISLSAEETDLGEIVNGEIKTVEIPLQNLGSGELIIEAVSTSCGCTTAEVQPTVIEPEGQATLRITYDSGAHGPEANGPVIRQVFIASNDPDQPEVEFRLLADVLPPAS